MIKKYSSLITNYIKENGDINSTDDLELINYSLQIILSETLKIITLIIIFLILGDIHLLLFSMIILFSIRIVSGGYHCNSTLSCLIYSIGFFIITSLLSPLLPNINILIFYVLSIFSLLIITICSPSPNVKRPIKSKKRRWILKLLSIFSIIIWLTILLFKVNSTSYLNCGFSTITLIVLEKYFITKGGTKNDYC